MNVGVENHIKERVIETFESGLRLYNCHDKNSDYIFNMIVESDKDVEYIVKYPNCKMNIYSESIFIDKVRNHDIDALECIFQNKNSEYLSYFELNKESLRDSLIKKSIKSNILSKNDFKNNRIEDGKMKLFNAIKIIGFGIQIALSGRILNYSAYNHYYDKLKSINSSDWDVYRKIFRKSYVKKVSNFNKFTT